MRVRILGLALLVLAACGDDAVAVPPPTAGVGAGGLPATAGMGGAGVGAGGSGGAPSAAGAGAGGAGGAAAGMGGAMAGMGGSGGSAAMPGLPTFTGVYNDIIAGTGCNGGISCHQASVAGMLPMSNKVQAYMNLVGKAAMGTNLGVVPPGAPNCNTTGMMRVVAGQPDMSLLVKKVEMKVPPCGGPMPPGDMAPYLTAAQQQQIRMWIMMGAKDD